MVDQLGEGTQTNTAVLQRGVKTDLEVLVVLRNKGVIEAKDFTHCTKMDALNRVNDFESTVVVRNGFAKIQREPLHATEGEELHLRSGLHGLDKLCSLHNSSERFLDCLQCQPGKI